MQVLLRIANGKSNVRKVRIQSDTVIGRSPECQLKVASNQISRRHCQIVIRDTVVAIKDLGSANGTFVNGRQVPPEVEIPLTPGTRVMLGPLQFTVEYDLPGMPALTVAATDEVAVSEAVSPDPLAEVSESEPQLQVETVQVVPPDGQTPFPPFVMVPPEQTVTLFNPLAVAPVAQVAVSPPATVHPVAVPPAPVPVSVATPKPVVAVPPPVVTAPAPIPVMAAPVAPPIAPPFPAAPPTAVAPQFFAPPAEAAADTQEEDSGGFNFGIFAASGSGVVVESAAEIPMISEPQLSEPAKVDTPKPAKKGLLQMFGWGKKKAATPEPEAAPDAAPAPEVNVAGEEVAIEEPAAEGGLSFEFPVAEDAPAADDDSPDESFQNLFNNLK